MVIGIDASRAFLTKRTGIEEYSFQVIKQLRTLLSPEDEVILYVRKKISVKNWRLKMLSPEISFDLPEHWRVRALWAPRFWTQLALSLEMLLHRPEVLFVPAHTVPMIHPKKTVVTVHGLEYEFCPESYSWWERFYMRWSIRRSVKWASQVIAVSENTKRDLIHLYQVPEEKIVVIYEGIGEPQLPNQDLEVPDEPYFLFVGRLEERKNVAGIIAAFELFSAKSKQPYQLVLAGKPGYGYKKIKKQIAKSKYRERIVETGYISEEAKWELLKRATVFVFPSFYEGFGLPVLEAQQVGTPVITSTTSSLPEVAGEGALLVEPTATKRLARALQTLVMDETKRTGIIDEATRNASRFSWAHCAREVASLLR